MVEHHVRNVGVGSSILLRSTSLRSQRSKNVGCHAVDKLNEETYAKADWREMLRDYGLACQQMDTITYIY